MAQVIRDGRWDDLDRENVVDEIESLGFRDRRRVQRLLSWIITELSLWWAQPERRCGVWSSRILDRRDQLEMILADSPSLQDELSAVVDEVLPSAVEVAVRKAGLINNPYPAHCSFTVEQILDADFWPDYV